MMRRVHGCACAIALLVAGGSTAAGASSPSATAEPGGTFWHGPVAEREPATEAAARVVETVGLVTKKIKATKYKHKTQVNLAKGIFYWDCSGMADWVLARSAPVARKALPDDRPLAKHFHGVIDKSVPDEPKKGWMRVEGPGDICPGDVFAWLKPPFWKKRKNTGHVGFVMSTPRPHPLHEGVWLMRIADATRYLHEDDTRDEEGEGGFGLGTIAFLFDGDGTAIAYGWYGSAQPPETFVPTGIVFGRVTK